MSPRLVSSTTNENSSSDAIKIGLSRGRSAQNPWIFASFCVFNPGKFSQQFCIRVLVLMRPEGHRKGLRSDGSIRQHDVIYSDCEGSLVHAFIRSWMFNLSRLFILCKIPHRSRARTAIMVASDWTRVADDQCPPYFVFTKPIQRSQQDDRDYRLIRLENGLHAMLVHDAKADKAAASLDVAVGHLNDPVSL